MEDVVVLGLLADDGFEGITIENDEIFCRLYSRQSSYKWMKWPPQKFYNYFKRELCGDLPIKWKQALQEANTLRLENLNK